MVVTDIATMCNRAGHQTEKILLHAFFCTTLQVMHVEAKKSENFCHLPWSRGSRSLWSACM